MERNEIIANLKALQEGSLKPLELISLFWGWHVDKEGLYECRTPGYQHLRLTKEQFETLADQGAYHIVWQSPTKSISHDATTVNTNLTDRKVSSEVATGPQIQGGCIEIPEAEVVQSATTTTPIIPKVERVFKTKLSWKEQERLDLERAQQMDEYSRMNSHLNNGF